MVDQTAITPASTASLLQSKSADIVMAACQHLYASAPDLSIKANEENHEVWRQHFSQRVTELSLALENQEPGLFISRLQWTKQAIESREQSAAQSYPSDALMVSSLRSLRYALIEVLHDNLNPKLIDLLDTAEQEVHANLPGDVALTPDTLTGRTALLYLEAALSGNSRQAANIVLNELHKNIDTKTAFLNVLMPAQKEIGRLWHIGEVTVAEEHLVTATTQHTMALIVQEAGRKPSNGHTAICASVAGNAHDLGIRAISYLLEIEGWQSIYLGSDTPPQDLAPVIEYYDADIALLSLALSVQLPALTNAITAVRAVNPEVHILTGGNAFNGLNGLWKKTGADGYAPDGEQAIELAKAFVETATIN